VKFKDDKTEFSISENVNGQVIMRKIGILTPSISKIQNIDFFNLEKDYMKDFITAYLFVKLILFLLNIPK